MNCRLLAALAMMTAMLPASLCAQNSELNVKVTLLTPSASDGHPDLNGLWNATTVNGPHLASDDPNITNLPSRDGSLVNYERDGAASVQTGILG
jgi:hypothetical protein